MIEIHTLESLEKALKVIRERQDVDRKVKDRIRKEFKATLEEVKALPDIDKAEPNKEADK